MTIKFPFGKMEIVFNVLDFDGFNLPRAQPGGNVAEYPVSFTAKDASAEEQVGPYQF